MIKLLGSIPRSDFYVACSGGIDSMAILDFLVHGGRKPGVLFFDHLTASSPHEGALVYEYCKQHDLSFCFKKIQREKHKTESLEEYWRNERYSFFSGTTKPVITGHHLDDVLETWLFSSFHGQSKLIPYRRNNVIRPFLLTEKKELVSWVEKHNVPYIVDQCNNDMSLMRNYIRANVVPHVYFINPGLKKNLKKKIMAKEKSLDFEMAL